MKTRILIVEDDSNNLILIRDLLTVKGYSTIEARDGKQGVSMAREHLPDLILMDMHMPIMDGLEATKMLKVDEATRNIPIIALTSYAMPDDKAMIEDAGVDGYIAKPIDIHDFIRIIEECFKSIIRAGMLPAL